MADDDAKKRAAVILLVGLGGLAVLGLRKRRADPVDDLPWEGLGDDEDGDGEDGEDGDLGVEVDPDHPLARTHPFVTPTSPIKLTTRERGWKNAWRPRGPRDYGHRPRAGTTPKRRSSATPTPSPRLPSSKQPWLPRLAPPSPDLPDIDLPSAPNSAACRITEYTIGGRFGNRQLCLTDSQLNTLKPDWELGCGAFACAYTRKGDPKNVVKFTSDPEDVAGMVANKHKHIAKVKAAYYLPGVASAENPNDGGGEYSHDADVYAMIVERLEDLTPAEDRVLRRFGVFDPLYNNFRNHYGVDQNPRRPDPKYNVPIRLHDNMVRAACPMATDDGGDECADFASGIIELHEWLGKRGFNWVDIHPGNIRRTKRGVWKVIDLGLSGKAPESIPVLQDMPELRALLKDLE